MEIGFGKLLVFCTLISIIFAAPEARAATIYSTGFEQPTFVLGGINGQGGWVRAGGGPAIIQDQTFASGSQALQLQATGPLSDSQTIAGLFPNIASVGKIVRVEVDFLRIGPQQSGLAVHGDTGFVAQLASVQNNFYVGNTNSSSPYVPYPMGVWYHLTLELNFSAQTAEGFVDGTSIGLIAMNPPSPTNQIAVISLYSNNTQGASQDAYFDNFSISVVPEPSTLCLVGLGGIGFVVRARRRRQ